MKTNLLFFLLFCKVLLATDIKGIVLCDPEQEIELEQGIHLYNTPIPSEELKEKLALFLRRPITSSVLQKIKEEILSFYSAHEHPLVAIHIPEQQVDQGIVRIHIIETKIDTIQFTGNRFFSTADLSRALGLKSGQSLQESSLLQKLSALNRNPFLYANAILSPGKSPKTSSLEIIVKDRFPLRFYSGVDNTGTDATSIYRYFVGANWAPYLWTLLSYQYTAALDFHKFWSHFGSWTLYLPWEHDLTFYGAFAKIHPIMGSLHTIGRSTQFSSRYVIPIRPLSKPIHSTLHFGYDYKQFNSALFFVESEGNEFFSTLESKNASISQFVLGLSAASSRTPAQFGLEVFFSPFHMLPNQTTFNYDLLREGAKTKYIYAKFHFSSSWKLPQQFSLNTICQAEVTGMPLLPSEQLGIGGHNTVRGYEEREYLADNGLCATCELCLPSLSFLKTNRSDFHFLAFTDYGFGQLLRPFSFEKRSQSFWSIGGGARFSILSHLTARVDYGYRLLRGVETTPFSGRFHFSVIGSF